MNFEDVYVNAFDLEAEAAWLLESPRTVEEAFARFNPTEECRRALSPVLNSPDPSIALHFLYFKIGAARCRESTTLCYLAVLLTLEDYSEDYSAMTDELAEQLKATGEDLKRAEDNPDYLPVGRQALCALIESFYAGLGYGVKIPGFYLYFYWALVFMFPKAFENERFKEAQRASLEFRCGDLIDKAFTLLPMWRHFRETVPPESLKMYADLGLRNLPKGWIEIFVKEHESWKEIVALSSDANLVVKTIL